jgi:iron complex outermembrane receptor protein
MARTVRTQNYGGHLRIRLGLGGMALHSITGYETVDTFSRGDIDGGFGRQLPAAGCLRPGQHPVCLRIGRRHPQAQSADAGVPPGIRRHGRPELAGRVSAFQELQDRELQLRLAGGGTQDGYLRVKQDNDAYAIFGNREPGRSRRLKLRGGLRYTRDSKNFQVEDYSNSGFAPCVGGAIPVPPKCTLAQLAGWSR